MGEAGDATGVRSSLPLLAAVIRQAAERSATFRSLVQAIEATDGIVYVEHGTCGSHARGCLLRTIAISGPHRILRILVDANAREDRLMATIGHELQHAIEVLSNTALRTEGALYLFYRRTGTKRGRMFETADAVQTGNTVRAEVRRSQQSASPSACVP
jgi:hypothetical protein